MAELGEAEPGERVGDHAVVHEDRAVPGRHDRELQVDVLQDTQVAADRMVLDGVEAALGVGGEGVLLDLDARVIELIAAAGGVAAGPGAPAGRARRSRRCESRAWGAAGCPCAATRRWPRDCRRWSPASRSG